MTAGHGDKLLAEGDPAVAEDEERLVEEFRRQLDLGMWAVVPREGRSGHHEATMVRDFSEVPRDAERVIFFPPAAGGSHGIPMTEQERAADARAEALLASVVGERAFTMYRELGFICLSGDEYGYLIYPHRPLVAYDAASREPLSEFCVRFHDDGGAQDGRLPDADDVLAKWMALRADEKLVIGESNLDRLGNQLDPTQVRRDLDTAALWELRRAA